MAVKRCEANIDVVKAAEIRIKNVFGNGLPVFFSFSGGKDSLCVAQLMVNLANRGEIDMKQLTVQFIDEEAIFPCMEDMTKKWRRIFMMMGAKFEWYCVEVKHFNCFNELSNDETFICWDSAKQDVWVRQPPSFAIRNHKLLRPRIDAYQDFLPRTTVSGITMVGIRTAESVQRLQNIASMTKAGNKMTAKKQVSPINGVTAITNSEKTSGGAEEENDEDYYERIHAEFQDSQFYVANDADYIKWAKEVPGIGDCIVEPAVEGPGTVGLILVDSNGQPASSTLVTAVYNHIVSPNDRSKRLLPTGSSKLIVKSATVKTVDFACTGLVLDGVGLDGVISTFKTEMMAVYSAAKETNILRYNSARTVLSTITGVSDFIDFTMDGKRENIHLSSSEYADTGNVTFALEGAET